MSRRHLCAAALPGATRTSLSAAEAGAATTRSVAVTAETFVTDAESTLLSGETKGALPVIGVSERPDSISGTFSFIEPDTPECHRSARPPCPNLRG